MWGHVSGEKTNHFNLLGSDVHAVSFVSLLDHLKRYGGQALSSYVGIKDGYAGTAAPGEPVEVRADLLNELQALLEWRDGDGDGKWPTKSTNPKLFGIRSASRCPPIIVLCYRDLLVQLTA